MQRSAQVAIGMAAGVAVRWQYALQYAAPHKLTICSEVSEYYPYVTDI